MSGARVSLAGAATRASRCSFTAGVAGDFVYLYQKGEIRGRHDALEASSLVGGSGGRAAAVRAPRRRRRGRGGCALRLRLPRAGRCGSPSRCAGRLVRVVSEGTPRLGRPSRCGTGGWRRAGVPRGHTRPARAMGLGRGASTHPARLIRSGQDGVKRGIPATKQEPAPPAVVCPGREQNQAHLQNLHSGNAHCRGAFGPRLFSRGRGGDLHGTLRPMSLSLRVWPPSPSRSGLLPVTSASFAAVAGLPSCWRVPAGTWQRPVDNRVLAERRRHPRLGHLLGRPGRPRACASRCGGRGRARGAAPCLRSGARRGRARPPGQWDSRPSFPEGAYVCRVAC
jgi:hypothetical protein